MQELGDLLKMNKTLSMLDLSYNRIMDEGFFALIKILEKAENLVSLNLSSNEITLEGLLAAQSSFINTRLKVLNLSKNEITDEGAQTLLSFTKPKNKGAMIRLNLV